MASIGNADATGVMITDAVPDNTAFAWAGGGGSLMGDEVRWADRAVGAGESLTVTFAVTVAAPLTDGAIITNANYGVTSAEGANAVGHPVTTMVITSVYRLYLPILVREYSGALTTLQPWLYADGARRGLA